MSPKPPPPKAGAVIRYSYLWHREALRGETEGRKHRPAAVVMTVRESVTGDDHVVVLPITHQQPADPNIAIELPARDKHRLNLDDEPSWIICDEYNQFAWPSTHVLPAAKGRQALWSYGLVSRALYEKVRLKVLTLRTERRLKRVARDQ